MIGVRSGQGKGGATAEQTQCLWYVAASENAVQLLWIILRESLPCSNFKWCIPTQAAVGQTERQWESRVRLTPAHPCSPLLTPPQVKIARARSGITPGLEEGELGADFYKSWQTSLRASQKLCRKCAQFGRVKFDALEFLASISGHLVVVMQLPNRQRSTI